MRFAACVLSVALALLAAQPVAARSGPSARGIVWLFFVDDLHIEFRTTGVVRKWLLSLVRDLIQDDDVFAARSTGPSTLSVGLLAGVEQLEQSILRFSGNALKREEVLKIPEVAEEIPYRAKLSMKAATEFLAIVPPHDPRRKVMLYIGKGFDTSDPLSDETQTLLTDAWRLQVTFIALDAGALPGAQRLVPYLADAERMRRLNATRSSLERLALPTQGFVLADEASLREAGVRITNAVR